MQIIEQISDLTCYKVSLNAVVPRRSIVGNPNVEAKTPRILIQDRILIHPHGLVQAEDQIRVPPNLVMTRKIMMMITMVKPKWQ